VPVASFGAFDRAMTTIRAWRDTLRKKVEILRESDYAKRALESPLADRFRGLSVELLWAKAHLMADPPGKIAAPAEERRPDYLGVRLSQLADGVTSELIIVSPYFVPGKRGRTFFGEKTRRGVRVRILTNSLAATDVWAVHAGYRRYRRALLRRGVEIHELKALTKRNSSLKGSSRASLHAKTFVLDRRAVFVGSINLDPRSLAQNTEVGVAIESPELAGQVTALFEKWTDPAVSWRVELVADGLRKRMRWSSASEQLSREPDAGFWRRLGVAIVSWLPVESQL